MNATLNLSILCTIMTDEADVAVRVARGEPVWSWCSSGENDWLEPRVVRTDVVCYLVPDFTGAISSDTGDDWPEGRLPLPERKILLAQLSSAYGRVWGFADPSDEPDLDDLCEDPECRSILDDLLADGLTREQVAGAIGIPDRGE